MGMDDELLSGLSRADSKAKIFLASVATFESNFPRPFSLSAGTLNGSILGIAPITVNDKYSSTSSFSLMESSMYSKKNAIPTPKPNPSTKLKRSNTFFLGLIGTFGSSAGSIICNLLISISFKYPNFVQNKVEFIVN